MNPNIDICRWLLPIALLANACGYDRLIDHDAFEEKTASYVELRIAMPTERATKSNPMGGEEGNGREHGLENEDRIHDINVFFYQEEPGKGMDSEGSLPICKHIYYNIDNHSDIQNTELWKAEPSEGNRDKEEYKPYFESNYLVLKFKCSDEDIRKAESTGLNFVALANVGPMQDISTLDKLMNYDLGNDHTNNWSVSYDAFSNSKDASQMDYFLMSTAYNEEYLYNGFSTGSNKVVKVGDIYSGVTTFQRMYARIDLWYNEANNAVYQAGETGRLSELKYSVDGAETNTVFLTNVLPVNVMKSPSYLIKRVTDAPELVWSPANSKVWDSVNLAGVKSFKWGGKETPSAYVLDTGGDLPTNYVMAPHTIEKQPGGDSVDVLAIWYGKTAVRNVRKCIQEDISNENASTDNGKFTAYWHGEQNRGFGDPDYGCDHISVISYANENTHPTDCFHSDYLTGLAFRGVYVPGRLCKGYVGNTLIEMSATERAAFDVEGKKIFRYSPTGRDVNESETLYFTDAGALDAYRADHMTDGAVVTEFEAAREQKDGLLGFACYYNLWLRHYNDEDADPQLNYPMEYATVRNNIYRVKVSFTGPGDPTPEMREPDTMQARIFVRNWNMRVEDNPLDF